MGIPIKSDKVKVIFEFDNEIELLTNSGRTRLYYNNVDLGFHQNLEDHLKKRLRIV